MKCVLVLPLPISSYLQNLIDCDHNDTTTKNISIFGILKYKTKKYHSTFLDRFWASHPIQRHTPQTSNSSTAYKRLDTSINKNVNQMLPGDAIAMQCLDVGSLLKFNDRRDYRRLQCDSITDGTVSMIGSSLDLEWEHEYSLRQQRLPASWHCSQNSSSSSSSEDDGCGDGSEPMIELSQITTTKSKPPSNRLRRRTQNKPNIFDRPASTTKLSGNENTKNNSSRSHISTPDSLEWDVQDDERKFKSEEDSLDRETMELLNEIEWLKNRALLETGDTEWKSISHGES